MVNVGRRIELPEDTKKSLKPEAASAYELLELARTSGTAKDQRKARRMLRKAGIYLSRTVAHNGASTLTPEPVRITTDTPAKAEARVNPAKVAKA